MFGGTTLLSINTHTQNRLYAVVFSAACLVAYLLLFIPTANAADFRTPDDPDEVLPAGVNYQYYEVYASTIPDFDDYLISQEGYADNFSIDERDQDDHFAFQWKAYFHAPLDGDYTFYINSDDGSHLYIGEEEVVYNDGLHVDRERYGTIGLEAGMHEMTVAYFENTGIQTFELEYDGPDVDERTTIPDSYLTRAYEIEYRTPDEPTEEVAGLYYEYYEEALTKMPNFALLEPIKTGNVTNISFDPVRQENYYQFQYLGYFKAPTDGVYTFYLESDDGSKLFIGEEEIVDNDRTHTVRERSGSIGLSEGYHEITIQYFEWIGEAVLQLYYEGPGIEKDNVPDTAFIRHIPDGSENGYYGDEIFDDSDNDDADDDSDRGDDDATDQDDLDDSSDDSEEVADDSAENDNSSTGDQVEVIYITNPSICEEPVKKVTAMRRGQVKVSYTDNSKNLIKVFQTNTTKKVKIASYNSSSYIVVLGASGKKLKMLNICNGDVVDTIRVAKKSQGHSALKLKDVRYDGSTEVMVTSTKGEWTRLSVVRVKKATKEFTKKSQNRFQTERNVAARKTKRRKRDGDHRLLVRDYLGNVVKTYKVTKKYELQALD